MKIQFSSLKNFLCVGLTFVTLSAAVRAENNDVLPKNFRHGSTYVRVTKTENSRVKFERCIKGYESSTCTRIGNKSSYRIKDLESQRFTENLQIGGALVGDVVVIVGFALGGGAVGAAATTATNLAQAIVLPILNAGVGATVGAGVGAVVISKYIDPLNPAEQARQAKTLSSDVINDVNITSSNIEEFIERLELVLSKIK